MKTIDKNNLKISVLLYDFINDEVIPGTNIESSKFWEGFSNVVHELAPINKQLLKKREDIQNKINEWHKANAEKDFDSNKYFQFLKSISYIVEPGEDFEISTTNVDEEISNIAGPQLVVPVDNARYALNAANARWGSLYDSLYGTDALGKIQKSGFDKDLEGVTQYGFGAHQTKSVDEILVEPFGVGDVELNGETIENPLRVNEKHIIPLLVKAIQELSTKNDELEARIKTLESS